MLGSAFHRLLLKPRAARWPTQPPLVPPAICRSQILTSSALSAACSASFQFLQAFEAMSACTLLLLWLASAAVAAAKDAAALGPALGRCNTLRRALQQAPPAPQAACNSSQTLEWVVQPYAPITMCRGGSLQLTWTGLCGAIGRTRLPCRQLLQCSDPLWPLRACMHGTTWLLPNGCQADSGGGPLAISTRVCLKCRLDLYLAGLSLVLPQQVSTQWCWSPAPTAQTTGLRPAS